MKLRLAVLAMGLAIGLFCGVPAWAVTDFSGEWTLNVARSDFGRANPPRALLMKVRQSEGQLAVESTLTDARGDSTSRYTLDLTGKETENVMRGNRVVSLSSWRGPSLQVKARTALQGAEVRTVDQWQMEDGGRVLTIYRTATTPNGEIEQRFVYEKR
jgi:hypothetical protein